METNLTDFFVVILLLAKAYLLYALAQKVEFIKAPSKNILFSFNPFFLFTLFYSFFIFIILIDKLFFMFFYEDYYYFLLIDNFFFTFLAIIYLKSDKV